MTSNSGTTDGRRVAMVLDAGGARSAYQVGALEVLLPELEKRGLRPSVLIGTSAGALITGVMGASAHLPAAEQVEWLRTVLHKSVKRNVIRPLWRQAPEMVVRYLSETLGLSAFPLRGLFGTEPLAKTLAKQIDWEQLHRNVDDGTLEAISVTTTSVRSGRVVMFTESAQQVPDSPPQYLGKFVATRLEVEHLMASSAIPVLFPAVRVDRPEEAAGWYVDGATRRREPLAPAIELGADLVVAVGTGGLHPPEGGDFADLPVDLGDGGATLLGAVMDDPLRHDVRRIADVNALTQHEEMGRVLQQVREKQGRKPYRTVPYVAIAPEDGGELAALAMEVFRANHGSLLRTLGDPDLQIMYRLMGSDSPLQGELLSYLMFDADFFEGAAAQGRRDAEAWVRDEPDLWRTEQLPEGMR